jgi:hypothetical protein
VNFDFICQIWKDENKDIQQVFCYVKETSNIQKIIIYKIVIMLILGLGNESH